MPSHGEPVGEHVLQGVASSLAASRRESMAPLARGYYLFVPRTAVLARTTDKPEGRNGMQSFGLRFSAQGETMDDVEGEPWGDIWNEQEEHAS